MPEGDTIHRAARTLQSALAGSTVESFETVFPALARVDDQEPVAGRRVERVFAEGKHLIVEFSGELFLRTHLRMNGTWHIYRRGERWQKRRSDMRVVVTTASWVAVGFNLPVAEFLDAGGLARHGELRRLGPDLLSTEFALETVLERARRYGETEIADLLLNQRVAAGIGNVYKSELLFVRGIEPFVPAGRLTNDELAALFTTARKLLQHNVQRTDAGRETRHGLDRRERLWVYGRRGQPCRRCGTTIEMRKQGPDARVTFWCPRCQPKRSG